MTETGKMVPDLSVKIAGVELKNPVMTWSAAASNSSFRNIILSFR